MTERIGEDRLREIVRLRQAWEEAEERARAAKAQAKAAFDAYNRARDRRSVSRAPQRAARGALVE